MEFIKIFYEWEEIFTKIINYYNNIFDYLTYEEIEEIQQNKFMFNVVINKYDEIRIRK